MFIDDTIVAISSTASPAARIVVRLSGPASRQLLFDLSPDTTAAKNAAATDFAAATRRQITFNSLSFPAWVYTFTAPRSYTGQDLVELHIPGNPLLARMLLDWLIQHNARSAEAGEFTARAYFAGKLDLAQAEGVAAAISAGNRNQLAAARRLMAGELSRRLRPAMEILTESLALAEVAIDFSEEDIQVLTAAQADRQIVATLTELQSLVDQSANFQRLNHEPTIVLAGRPNAGKSTLTNALAGRHRSIVSPLSGTTRDALSIEIPLLRGPVRLIDIAGLIDSPADSRDGQTAENLSIETQSQRHAHRAIQESDILILVHDATDPRPHLLLERRPDLTVLTKIDLLKNFPTTATAVPLSAATGQNLDTLRTALDAIAFGSETSSTSLALTSRHLQAIEEARTALDRARHLAASQSLELLAAELRHALDALGQILGVVTPDDVLGRIFSTFCIGK